MSYPLLLGAHVAGAILLGTAAVTMWRLDEQARRATDCGTLLDAARRTQVLGKRLLMPSVLLLAASGIGLVALHWGAWNFVRLPWLAAMAGLFVFQSVWAQVVTRPRAQRIDRLLAGQRSTDRLTPALEQTRDQPLARFGQHLEPLTVLLALGLGVLRPMDWLTILAAVTTVAAAAGLAATATRAAAPAYKARLPAPPSSCASASVNAEGRR